MWIAIKDKKVDIDKTAPIFMLQEFQKLLQRDDTDVAIRFVFLLMDPRSPLFGYGQNERIEKAQKEVGVPNDYLSKNLEIFDACLRYKNELEKQIPSLRAVNRSRALLTKVEEFVDEIQLKAGAKGLMPSDVLKWIGEIDQASQLITKMDKEAKAEIASGQRARGGHKISKRELPKR